MNNELRKPFRRFPKWMLLLLMAGPGLVLHLLCGIFDGLASGIHSWSIELRKLRKL